jgi:hypothetical protein
VLGQWVDDGGAGAFGFHAQQATHIRQPICTVVARPTARQRPVARPAPPQPFPHPRDGCPALSPLFHCTLFRSFGSSYLVFSSLPLI